MTDRVKPQGQPRRYDWHHQDQDCPTHVGIYRIINANLHLFEEDFIHMRLDGADDQRIQEIVDRTEFICQLLNEGLVTERQAYDIFLVTKLRR